MSQRIRKSWEIYSEAQKVIPGGSQMYNKRPSIYSPAEYPIFVKSARGAYFTDVDNNEYIDYLLAYGAILLGYNYPPVVDAVKHQIDNGTIFSVNHELEIALAKELIETIPSAEMVRYFLSGSEATTAAVKIARAYTGKYKVVRWGYHGWHDWCSTGESGPPKTFLKYLKNINCSVQCLRGVPPAVGQYTLELKYNDLNFLEDLLKREIGSVACIIMEPFYYEQPQVGFLEGAIELAHQHEVLFILDEVKTGGRVSSGGAQEYLGITPDLSIFSKGLANGYPFSLVVGKKEFMKTNEALWYAGTNSGNLVGISATLSTMRELKSKDIVPHIWNLGRKLMYGLDDIANDLDIEGKAVGYPPMPSFNFLEDDEETNQKMADIFLSECISRGVFYPKDHVWFISYSHTEKDINKTLEISREALRKAKEKV